MVSEETFKRGWAMLVGAFPDKRLEDGSMRVTYATLLRPLMDDETFVRAVQAAVVMEEGAFAPSVNTLTRYAQEFRQHGLPDPFDVARMRIKADGAGVDDTNYERVRRALAGGEAGTIKEAVSQASPLLARLEDTAQRAISEAQESLQLVRRAKCDGNHGGEPCADRECWLR